MLFVSFACYLDDANGAAVASRAMMEALARRGFAVAVLCGPILELNSEIDLASFLTGRGLPVDRRGGDSWDVGSFGARPRAPLHLFLNANGVPITILSGSTRPRAPTDDEQQDFLWLFEEASARPRPEVVVSYGGGSLTREVLRRAKVRGAASVFTLHNLRYHDPATFSDVDTVLVASRFAAEHYRSRLGLQCTALSNLVNYERALASDRRPKYVVFVNPTIEKGVGVFARIADELGRRRPEIPFLVVEGRGTEADVAACGLDLRAHGNVFFHEHTSDPRRFWRVARVCLLPSVVGENQPLVAIEAMINGVPVIGSNRGGIPETLGTAGSVLPIPDRLSPTSPLLPTPGEINPWVEAILELWDSPEVYERASRRALIEARRWAPDTLEPRYERFFATIGLGRELPIGD
ncbi:MAG: glycosyltransferase [Isosphaerales bacterium]